MRDFLFAYLLLIARTLGYRPLSGVAAVEEYPMQPQPDAGRFHSKVCGQGIPDKFSAVMANNRDAGDIANRVRF
ncbi:hypothetical protein [Janthinobacterium lividum]|uniref:hypothetical protein n=1 Tax=Janthinobacterium lividum TaxID=29581 RepID=UPI0014083375|nr:hypothetical protein [Janthinobacterium lividum]NHQ92192.1 hypothetical protein [Janthinobacterium lividum]